jgi:hypothetical protein
MLLRAAEGVAERVQQSKNLLKYLAPFFGLREALNRAQILSPVR